jgi:iron complex outermembrane recepter protein
VDAVALVGERLTLNSSMAYIDATIDKYPNAQCYNNQTIAQGCVETAPGSGVFVQDLAGKSLNNAPDFKFTLGAQYTQPLDSLPFDGFANASYEWQDDVIFDLKHDPGTWQGSYGVLNIGAGINERAQDRYRVTLFVYNVFDQDYTRVIADLSDLYLGGTAYIQLVPRSAQRYAGVSVKYAF